MVINILPDSPTRSKAVSLRGCDPGSRLLTVPAPKELQTVRRATYTGSGSRVGNPGVRDGRPARSGNRESAAGLQGRRAPVRAHSGAPAKPGRSEHPVASLVT